MVISFESFNKINHLFQKRQCCTYISKKEIHVPNYRSMSNCSFEIKMKDYYQGNFHL